jgi:septum formation protein
MSGTAGEIILASASQSRQGLLKAAGIAFRTMSSGVDESAIKREHNRGTSGFGDLALRLAIEKALAVASRNPGAMVIGADQILVVDEEALDKPESVEVARQQLTRLRGNTHRLETAIACVKGRDVLWSHIEAPHLTMRAFSSAHLEAYLAAEGPAVTETVGGYKVEGRGIQLFETISGDHCSILGLPLLPLLGFLRSQGAIPA